MNRVPVRRVRDGGAPGIRAASYRARDPKRAFNCPRINIIRVLR